MAKKEMSKLEVLEEKKNLESVTGIKSSVIGYAISKTLGKFKSIVKHLRFADNANEPFIEYQKKLEEINEEFADRGADDKPLTVPIDRDGGFKYLCTKRMHERRKKVDALDIEYKKCLDERKAFLEKEEKVEIHQVAFDDIPKDADVAQVRLIEILLK